MQRNDTQYESLTIDYDDKFVHIQTDPNLFKFLGRAGNDSIYLAKHIKSTYKLKFGKELQISVDSLSVEILVHAYLDIMLKAVSELGKLLPIKVFKDLVACMDQLEGHTKIIDCGEKDVDSNRHVFDSLVPYKHFIYIVLGRLS